MKQVKPFLPSAGISPDIMLSAGDSKNPGAPLPERYVTITRLLLRINC